jgi:hypothetical protein
MIIIKLIPSSMIVRKRKEEAREAILTIRRVILAKVEIASTKELRRVK